MIRLLILLRNSLIYLFVFCFNTLQGYSQTYSGNKDIPKLYDLIQSKNEYNTLKLRKEKAELYQYLHNQPEAKLLPYNPESKYLSDIKIGDLLFRDSIIVINGLV